MSKKKYIVIHGFGSTTRDAALMLGELGNLACHWYDGEFLVPRNTAVILRKIFNEAEDEAPLFRALRKIAVGGMLAACASPSKPEDMSKYSNFDEYRLCDNFTDLAVPVGPASRAVRSESLRIEGEAELLGLFGRRRDDASSLPRLVGDLYKTLHDEDGAQLHEEAAARALRGVKANDAVIASLRELRDFGERGADLDTISSATFYAHALRSEAAAGGGKLLYGRDYQFVFIQYHDGLKPLADNCLGPGELYIADIPISTIPDLPGDAAFMAARGVSIARYEDHHPYTAEHMAMLERLRSEGLIGQMAMSGPLQGEELSPEQLKCAGDMTYEAMIHGKPWDTPAMAYLRQCVHGEDLALERTETGKLLTELIKGGVNSIELCQTLLGCRDAAEIDSALAAKGWEERIIKERAQVADIADRFHENIQLLEIERPQLSDGDFSGPALGEGSDMPMPVSKRQPDDDKLRILLVLAPRTRKGEPKLKIGRAQEYFLATMPHIDYLFFCYGASIMVTRRLNQADTSLNLSNLMRRLGTENDGGHAGAAVCCPEKNPEYPKHILGRVSATNFSNFCRYLAMRIGNELGVAVRSRRDISRKRPPEAQTKGTRRLIYMVAASIIIGLLVMIFNSNYRRDKIRQLNQQHFQWISAPPAETEGGGEGD